MTPLGLRRLLHASTALVVLLGSLVSWTGLRVLLLTTALGAVLFEALRIMVPTFGSRVRALVPVYRETESRRPSGAMWLAVGYGVAALFPAAPMVGGIVVGAVADPTASWLGSLGTATGTKTWRGSVGHFMVATVLLAALGFSVWAVLAAAAVGTALERWSGPVDDNLLVAPGVALTLTLPL